MPPQKKTLKPKRPSNFTLLIPLAVLLLFAYLWSAARDIVSNGVEHHATITGKRTAGGRYAHVYSTFNLAGKNLEVAHRKQHQIGDTIEVIVLGHQALEGKKTDSVALLAIRDFNTLYFWIVLIMGFIFPLCRWLSYLPDKAFAWIPIGHRYGRKRKRDR